MKKLNGKSILLIISGGIAAYKALELLRFYKKEGAAVRCILTKGGAQFITPLSVSALSEEKTYTDLWDLKDETEMGHIRLARDADLIVIAPASAHLMAQMAHGLAEDLASTTLLAADNQILIAPAMNPVMWQNSATQTNIAILKKRGINFIEPEDGLMACGETGPGRLAEPHAILEASCALLDENKPLSGKTALVTAGPTYEALDPVRFIGNRSSGKQGYAIAQELRDLGASITLVSGPTSLPAPDNINFVRVETAQEMHNAALAALPADIAICAAAVSDWKAAAPKNIKHKKNKADPVWQPPLIQTDDILQALGDHAQRPRLLIGFAAETNDLQKNAETKLEEKGCDWLIANDVSQDGVFGGDDNSVIIFRSNQDKPELLEKASKTIIARDIAKRIVQYLDGRLSDTYIDKKLANDV